MARCSKVRIENIDNASREANIAAGNIVKNTNTIHQGVLNAPKEANYLAWLLESITIIPVVSPFYGLCEIYEQKDTIFGRCFSF